MCAHQIMPAQITPDRPMVIFGAFVLQNRVTTGLLDAIVVQPLCSLVMAAKSVLGPGSGWVPDNSSLNSVHKQHLGPLCTQAPKVRS